MGRLLSYSGISTKIRAMQSKLISESEIQEMLQFTSVSHAAAWLKRTPEYAKAWADLDENTLHRGQIENCSRLRSLKIFPKYISSQIRNSANFWIFIPGAMRFVY